MSLINCEINLLLTWSFECLILCSNKDNEARTGHMIFSSESRNKRLQCYDRWKNVFDWPLKIDLRTYDNIKKIVTCQINDDVTDSLRDHHYN